MTTVIDHYIQYARHRNSIERLPLHEIRVLATLYTALKESGEAEAAEYFRQEYNALMVESGHKAWTIEPNE